MSKFKVGDKVKTKYGIGELVETQTGLCDDFNLVRIKGFDGHKGNGHCRGHYETNDHWYLFDEDIKLANKEQITITRHNRTVVATDGNVYGVARCCPEDEFDFHVGAKLAFERFMEKTDKKVVREVKRQAKVGEWIKFTSNRDVSVELRGKVGKVLDIDFYGGLRVEHEKAWEQSSESRPGYEITHFSTNTEYVVLENYVPEEKEQKPQYFNGKVVCIETIDGALTAGKIYSFQDGLSRFDNGMLFPQSDSREPFKSVEEINDWILRGSKFIPFVESEGK